VGAFRYCHQCDKPLNKPTCREDLLENFSCDRCGRLIPKYQSIAEWVVELEERLCALEAHNKEE
jgi:hydrogenase maturation factor HypF (carbamoyltransferase family)